MYRFPYKPWRWFALECILFPLAFPCFAQKSVVPYNFYGPSEGLSSSLVTTIYQDTVGYLWLGTNDGLNQWNGYDFKKFLPESTKQPNLSDRYIVDLEPVFDQQLLVRYNNNIDFFDLFNPYTKTVKKVNLYPANGIQGNVQQITVGPDQLIYILTLSIDRCRIYRYDQQDSIRQVGQILRDYSGLQPKIDLAVLPDSSYLINDSKYGLERLYPNGRLRPYFTSDLQENRLMTYPAPASILKNTRDGERTFLAFAKNPNLFVLHHRTNTWSWVEGLGDHPGMEFSHLWEDGFGHLLVNLTNGNGIYPVSQKLFFLDNRLLPTDWSFVHEISQYLVDVFANDFHRTLFIGADTGLKTYKNTNQRIFNYLDQSIKEDEYGAVMKGITYAQNGDVFLAREYTHWYRVNGKTGHLDTLEIYTANDPEPIQFKCSYDLLHKSDQTLWGIACRGDGKGMLIKYDLQSQLSTIYEYPHRFFDLIYGRDQNIWLLANGENGNNQLIRFNPEQPGFEVFTNSEGNNPFKGSVLNCLIESGFNTLWVGTDKGLYQVNREVGATQKFDSYPELDRSIIRTLAYDFDGRLWIGTSGGLVVLSPDGEWLYSFNEENGLSNNNVSTIVPDQEGNVWVSTDGGLNVWLPKEKALRQFYRTDGFPTDNFTTNSGLNTPANQMYLGTTNGFSRFNPSELLAADSIPSPQLHQVLWYDSDQDTLIQLSGFTGRKKNIILSPGYEYIDFSFFLPLFENPDRNKYQVRLWPLEKDWIFLKTKNTIRYSRVPAGKYTLEIKAAAPSGQWGENILTIPVLIKPYWYQTTLAKVVFILGALGLVYLAFQIRLNQKIKVERFRTKLSSDIHDEVSGLLSGIAFQSDLLQREVDVPEQKKKLEHISQVSRKAASQLHDVIWSIDSRKDHFSDLRQRMQEHAEDVLINQDIQFDIRTQNIDDRQRIPINLRQNIYFIFKEAINNVAKHAKATQVIVSLEKTKSNGLHLWIHDNGLPDHQEKQTRTGQGLSNIKMRAQRLGGQLTIDQQEGFTIHLFLKKW